MLSKEHFTNRIFTVGLVNGLSSVDIVKLPLFAFTSKIRILMWHKANKEIMKLYVACM